MSKVQYVSNTVTNESGKKTDMTERTEGKYWSGTATPGEFRKQDGRKGYSTGKSVGRRRRRRRLRRTREHAMGVDN